MHGIYGTYKSNYVFTYLLLLLNRISRLCTQSGTENRWPKMYIYIYIYIYLKGFASAAGPLSG